jgi:hypothetical protein
MRVINFSGSDSRRADAQTSRQPNFAHCIVPSQTRQSGASKYFQGQPEALGQNIGDMLPLSFPLANTFIVETACH